VIAPGIMFSLIWLPLHAHDVQLNEARPAG
jgi:hypothetical protein